MQVKDYLVKLVKENKIIAIAAAILITASVIYLVIFIPMMKGLKAKFLECRRCEGQVIDARNMIDYARSIGKSYGGRVLISEKEASTAIDEFTKHGKALGINFVSIKPKSVIIKEGVPYKVLPIELDLEASDTQFVDFMGSIDELKKAIVTLDNFDITPDTQNRKVLHAKMVANIYLSAKENGQEEL